MAGDIDPDRAQAIANRDQLWASLRDLRSVIDRVAQNTFDGSELERQIIVLLARIVQAELDFRERP
jgi:hypothetical protein